MAHWEFLPNPGREEEGLGHAGIETFKGSPYPGIARECSQNSLDASARRPDGTSEPVHLIFRLLLARSSEIPGLQDLKGTFAVCLKQAKTRNHKKDKEFFERAIRIADRPNIPVLLMEDYGTTGLVGPAVEGTAFHALVKSSGISQKTDTDAGGSFGIGKNAAFTISSLRTVFYSTCYLDGGEPAFLAQGKSILVSHDEGSGPKRSTGYWGNGGYMPVDNTSSLPAWLRRNRIGTTVASIGFSNEPGWEWLMTESLIRNFFSAIQDGSIRFTVQRPDVGPIEIDKDTVTALFDESEVRAAAESSGTTDDLTFSAAMLEALKSPVSERSEQTFAPIGTFKMTLLQKDGFPRRLGILRNGMYIADNLKHFGHPMARFPMSKDFVALLEPANRDTSSQIRDMESPRHDEISPERIDELDKRKRYKSAMKAVGTWVRETIKASTTKPAEAVILLDEMNRFFSNPSAGKVIPDPTNINNDPERPKIALKPTAPKPRTGSGDTGESGSSGGLKQSKTKSGQTSGERQGPGRGVAGGRGGRSIPYFGLRSSKSGSGATRLVALTPEESATVILEIVATGVSSNEALGIRSIGGTPCSRSPRVFLEQGARANFEIEFDTPYSGPIRVVLTPIDGEADAH
ncbi:hypothetical protein ACVCL0_04180 [Rhodanobacter sp. UC4450_H17]